MSVSSMRSTNVPPWAFANSQFTSAVRMFPTCSLPVGEGAKRTLTVMCGYSGLRRGWPDACTHPARLGKLRRRFPPYPNAAALRAKSSDISVASNMRAP